MLIGSGYYVQSLHSAGWVCFQPRENLTRLLNSLSPLQGDSKLVSGISLLSNASLLSCSEPTINYRSRIPMQARTTGIRTEIAYDELECGTQRRRLVIHSVSTRTTIWLLHFRVKISSLQRTTER